LSVYHVNFGVLTITSTLTSAFWEAPVRVSAAPEKLDVRRCELGEVSVFDFFLPPPV